MTDSPIRTHASPTRLARCATERWLRAAAFIVSSAAISCSVSTACAEPISHQKTARLEVSVTVVSTCSIDSRTLDPRLDVSGALDVSCAQARIAAGAIHTLSTGTGRAVLATVNF